MVSSSSYNNKIAIVTGSSSGIGYETSLILAREYIVNDAEKQIEQLIYEFVYDLASSATNSERGREFLYYCEILSRDHKFMRMVEGIYENRHKGFERGCDLLRKYNPKR
jgi:NAD(P)-dependent dehydrogenase (short-subunit alcohol dehydrogenase family)